MSFECEQYRFKESIHLSKETYQEDKIALIRNGFMIFAMPIAANREDKESEKPPLLAARAYRPSQVFGIIALFFNVMFSMRSEINCHLSEIGSLFKACQKGQH